MALLVGTEEGVFVLGDPDPVLPDRAVAHVGRWEDQWWACSRDGVIFRDGRPVAALPDGAVPTCVQPTGETVWVGADRARLYRLVDGDLIRDEAFDRAPGRGRWYTPWGGPPDVRSLTVDAGGTLYVNVHVGGVLRHDGSDVVPLLDIDADAHQVVGHRRIEATVFAATAVGLAQSIGGAEFGFRTEGLHDVYCRAVAVGDDRVFVSASTGPSSVHGRLYRAPLREGPLEPMISGLPEWFAGNVDTHHLTVHEGSVYVGFGATVWASADDGATWVTAADGLPRVTCLA